MTKTELLSRIVSSPKTFSGAPCVRDTRVRVESVLTLLTQGVSYEDVMEDMEITREDILACIAYALTVIHGDTLETVEVQHS